MTRNEAKKKILGLFLSQLTGDDRALFGEDVDEGTHEWRAYDGARDELLTEFARRTKE